MVKAQSYSPAMDMFYYAICLRLLVLNIGGEIGTGDWGGSISK